MRRWIILAALLSLSGPVAAQPAEEPRLRPVRLDAVSVSGISSGAYMAVQFAVLNTDKVVALGAQAGGPFFCAGDGFAVLRTTNRLWFGSGECMEQGVPDLARSVARARDLLGPAERERLKAQRVWLYSGSSDRTVVAAVVDKLYEFLAGMGVRDLTYERGEAAHGHLLDLPGGGRADCIDQDRVAAAGFFADCDVAAARRVLEKAYGPPQGPRRADDGGARLFPIDQRDLLPDFRTARARMAETGHVYVPEVCERESCRVHVAFHGCLQGEAFGDGFARRAGYNEWAEAYRAVILYPRIRKDDPLNERGCWDWWGYTDASYSRWWPWSDGGYATRQAPQVEAVNALLARLAAPRR